MVGEETEKFQMEENGARCGAVCLTTMPEREKIIAYEKIIVYVCLLCNLGISSKCRGQSL